MDIKSFFTALFILFFCLCSCLRKGIHSDTYYTDHGDWGDVRFPLIKPYEALRLNGDGQAWIIQTTSDSKSFFLAPGAREVIIADSIVFIHSVNTILNGLTFKEAWFVLIPGKHIENGFGTYKAYQTYLHDLHIDHEPKLFEMDKVARYFGDHDTIDWKKIDN